MLRNLAANRRKGDRRREAREQAAQATAPDAVPSAEDLALQLEGRSSADIARALGVPEGTVRWRLKSALERLRAQLAAEDGDARWRARLALLVGRPRRHGGPGVAVWAVGGAACVAAVAAAVAVPRVQPSVPRPALPTMWTAAAEPPGAGVAAVVATGRPEILAACQAAVGRLRAELVEAEAELRRWGDVRKGFAERPPSEHAQAVIAPIIQDILGATDAGAASHRIECRGGVCMVTFVCRDADECERQVASRNWRHPELARRTWGVSVPRDYRLLTDTLTGEALRQYTMEVRPIDPDGAPVDGNAPVPAAPAPATPAACRAERVRLEDRLRVVRPERDRVAPADSRFRREPPNAPLTAATRAHVARVLGPRIASGVECRGEVCRVPLDGAPTRDPRIGESFETSQSFRDAVKRLDGDGELRKAFGGSHSVGVGAAYVDARNKRGPDDDRGYRLIHDLLFQGGRFAPFAVCTARFTPDGGHLHISIVVPAAGELNDDGTPDAISAHVDGTADAAELGRCIAAEIRSRVRDVRPPPLPKRAVLTMEYGFPPRSGRP